MKFLGFGFSTLFLATALCALFSPPRLHSCVTLDIDIPADKCGESDCQFYCAIARPDTRAEKHMPGFDVAYEDGLLTVVDIFLNSPAERAGLKIGDKLISFDGSRYPLLDPTLSWNQPGQHLVTVQRGSENLGITITPVTMTELLSRMPRVPDTVAVGFGRAAATKVQPRPFVSGMTAEKQGDSAVVKEVLAGSPADLAGIKPGDEILQWTQAAADLMGSDTPRVITLSVESNGTKKGVSIQLVPLSKLWSLPAHKSMHEKRSAVGVTI